MRHPEVKVELLGTDGNAHAIIGRVRRAMALKKVPADEISEFMLEAMSDHYGHVLRTVMEWVEVS